MNERRFESVLLERLGIDFQFVHSIEIRAKLSREFYIIYTIQYKQAQIISKKL